jgi:hypothetical protein
VKTVWFDSTFGSPWLSALVHVFLMRKSRQPYIRHIFEVSSDGENDDIWIDKIDGGERIVISCDQGHDKPRLPAECKKRNITHIIFSSAAHNQDRFEKARAIIMLWPDILETFNAPLGSRFQIGKAQTNYVLTVK